MVELKHINKKLRETYGGIITGQALFRVVWSDDQLEKRIGVFAEHYGKIFIREIRGLQEVQKYPYIKSRWVLERYIPPNIAYTREIPDTINGSYEPVFVHQDAMGNPLPVIWEKLEQYIFAMMHPNQTGHQQSLDRTADALDLEKEIEFHRMVLEDAGRSWIGHRLSSREAIVVP